MADTSDILLVAGAAGLGWWIYRQHDDDKRRTTAIAASLAAHQQASGGAAPARAPAGPTSAAPPPAKAPKLVAPSVSAAPTAAPTTVTPIVVRVPTQPITRAFDPLFAAYGPTLPTAYLRALAAHESDMHPDAAAGRGRGLFSVVDILRTDFNDRHGTHFSANDLLNAIVNVQIAADFIRNRIISSYAQHHPDIANLREDWTNPRFVELVTFGWNAGYSERGGIGRVATVLAQQGRREITLDVVLAAAIAAGATPHLADPNKARFCRDVAATYQRERARDEHDGKPTAPPAAPLGPAPAPAIPTTTDPTPAHDAAARAPK